MASITSGHASAMLRPRQWGCFVWAAPMYASLYLLGPIDRGQQLEMEFKVSAGERT